MNNETGDHGVTPGMRDGMKTFAIPAPGQHDASYMPNASKISKSNSEARFNHSGMVGSHGNSSIFNHSGVSSRNFGDKVYNRQSASTLLHSINSYSMPKAARFANSRQDNFDNGGIQLKSTLESKGTNFSKCSNRKPLIKVENASNPGPGQYPVKSDFGNLVIDKSTKKLVGERVENKGKTFGISAAAYKNTFSIGMDKNVAAEIEVLSKPGPGSYALPKTFGKSGKACTLAPKLALSGKSGGIGPIYTPNYRLVEPCRYDVHSMGKGGRYDFTKQSQGLPGPEYHLPSVFDKYRNTRMDGAIEKARLKSTELANKKSVEKKARESDSLLNDSKRSLICYN